MLYVIYCICLYHCLWSLEQHWQAVEDPDQGVTATGCPRSMIAHHFGITIRSDVHNFCSALNHLESTRTRIFRSKLSWVDWDIFKTGMEGVSLHSIWHLRVHSFVYFTFSDDYPYTCKCETWHRFMLRCWAFLCFPATWKTVELNHDLREIVDANQIITVFATCGPLSVLFSGTTERGQYRWLLQVTWLLIFESDTPMPGVWILRYDFLKRRCGHWSSQSFLNKSPPICLVQNLNPRNDS